ncbi:MAG: hypothetical protein NDJ75_00150 [Thermoanaerobaculia bacterium]|nr:hypothetical protein [Thermoanaerobaculia bacterium]
MTMRRGARGRRSLRLLSLAAAALALAIAAGPTAGQSLSRRLLRYAAVIDGAPERPLRWPVAVAAGAADELAVADAFDNRLVVFYRLGAGWPVRREVPLAAPPAAVTWADGRFLVALRGDAGLVAVEGGESEAPPAAVALPDGIVAGRLATASDGTVVVWDSRGRRVVWLQRGAIAAQAPIEESVTGLGSDLAGGVWAAIGERGELRRFDREGRPVAVWKVPADGPVPAWPVGVVAEPGGRLFVLDRHRHRIVVLDGSGQSLGLGSGMGWEPGQLLFPDGIARLSGGALLVSDGGNGRAQLFEPTGPGAG